MAVAADAVISVNELGEIQYFSPAAERMFGYSAEEMMGRSLDVLLPERFRASHSGHVAGYAGGEGPPRRLMAARGEVAGLRRNGEEFPLEVSLARSETDDATILTAVLRDVSERKALEEELNQKTRALQKSEERLRLALHSGRFGVWEWNLQTDSLEMDRDSRKNFGLPPEGDLEADDMLERIDPDDRIGFQAEISRAIDEDTNFETEFSLIAEDGAAHRISAVGAVREWEGESAKCLVGINFNVTRRWQAEQERELLSREIFHRLKNAMAVTRSLVSLSASHADSVADFETTLQGRLSAVAGRHTLLMREGWKDAGLESLLTEELRAYAAPGGANLEMEGPPVRIAAQPATALGLALHELATNAAKYGALSRPEGKLALTWHIEGEEKARRLHLQWTEQGAPPPSPSEHTGFGTRVIDATIRRQLQGSLDRQFASDGLKCTIEIPLINLEVRG